MAAERYILELDALPGEIPVEIRLRQALKVLRRRFGFNCRAVRLEQAAAAASPVAPTVAPFRHQPRQRLRQAAICR